MEQISQIREIRKRTNCQFIRTYMTVTELCQFIVGKTIVEAEAYYDNSQLNITLDDGTYIEINCDSVYSEIPDLDD